MGNIRLYFRYVKVNIYGFFSFKGWPLGFLLTFVYAFTDPLEIFLLVARFKRVGAFSGWQITLVYATAILCFGLAETLARGFDSFPFQVRYGVFDRVLLRPRNTFIQVLGMRFHPHRLVRVMVGAVMVGVCMWKLQFHMTPIHILMFTLAVIGGLFTYTAVFIFGAAMSFWFIEDIHWLYILTNGSYQAAKVPPPYLPRWLLRFFTVVVPMFAFCYYPMSVIGGWGEPAWTGWTALPMGMLALLLASGLWKLGMGKYAGTGS